MSNLKLKRRVIQIPHEQRILDKALNKVYEKNNIDIGALNGSQRHQLLCKIIHKCKLCNNARDAIITPTYKEKPKLMIISRASTKKDINSANILSPKHSSYNVTEKLVNGLGFTIQETYYTNTVFCASRHPNFVTSTLCNNCYLYKKHEFDCIELPRVIITFGNDILKAWLGENRTAQNLLGDIFVCRVKGVDRLIIPLPHQIHLVREPELLESSMFIVDAVKKVLELYSIDELIERANV